jgi:hypothetical protein
MSVKVEKMKVVFRYSESTSGPIIKPQWPPIFDLIDESKAPKSTRIPARASPIRR